MAKYVKLKIYSTRKVLPLRNWRDTSKRIVGVGSAVKHSYSNAQNTAIKAKASYLASKEKAKELKQHLKEGIARTQRVGIERTITSTNSIYQPRPSERIKKVFAKVRRHLGGGLYG